MGAGGGLGQSSIVNPSLFDWFIFHIIIIILIIIDLKTLEHEDRDPSFKETAILTILWIGVGVLFGVIIWFEYGFDPALLYFTAFIAEKSLSLDNMFVFYAIFAYFGVKYRYQHKVLLIGILSAIFFRAVFILAGIYLIETIKWTVFVFGAILIISGLRLTKGVEEEVDPSKNPIVKFAKKHLPIVPRYYGSHFMVRINGKRMFTPMILVLLAIETTDIIFAVDSVPAVLAITTDFYIAYTSNIMAILGLRALYMFVVHIIRRLEYIHIGLGFILVYLGVKMIFGGFGVHISPIISLAVLLSILSISIVGSLIYTRRQNRNKEVLGQNVVEEGV